MQLNNLINNKLNDVRLNLSKGTLNFYISHTNHFLNWCDRESIVTTSDLTDDKLLSYIEYNKETCTNATINKRIGILKRVYEFSQIDNPFLFSIGKLKENKKTFNMISDSDSKKIIKYCNTLTEDKLMYKALIFLLFDTGARINEIMNIEIKNINFKENEILLTTTKTDNDRYVYFLNDTAEILKEIINKKITTKYLLFNILKNRQINYDDVRYFMRHLKSELDINMLHPHMFRHTFATKWLENGADLFSVMKVIGHTNIETTERYIHMSTKLTKKNYKKNFKR